MEYKHSWLPGGDLDFVRATFKGEKVFIKQLWYKEEDMPKLFRCLSLPPHPNILLPLGFAHSSNDELVSASFSCH